MPPDKNSFGTPRCELSRRDMLCAALAGSGWMMKTVTAATLESAKLKPSGDEQKRVKDSNSPSTAWTMMFDLTVRIPAGRFEDWVRFWGGENISVLEENGQWLWGAWTSVTGQQNTITHQWAYRDLAHYQDMAKMRATNPRVRELAPHGVPIEETLLSSVMTPLSYHPATASKPAATDRGIIVTNRIYPRNTGSAADHARLAAEYVGLAAKHGAQLVGAFQSFFGWTPSYLLQVWRYPSIEQYWSSRREIDADPDCQHLLTQMRSIYPHETVDLHRPMPYSRLL